MPIVYLSLGSNVGDRSRNLRNALALIAAEGGVQVLRGSDVWETEAVGGPPQRHYLNLVVAIKTNLEPLALLVRLLAIEAVLGRRRVVRDGPRTIDIDILTYGRRTMRHPLLTLPHPRMRSRLFVLAPLAQTVSGQLSDVSRQLSALSRLCAMLRGRNGVRPDCR